jgi:hypothetical protein
VIPQSLSSAWPAFGVLLALLVLAASSRWREAGLWFALAIAGQLGALAIYEAGPSVSYHHYRPVPDSARALGAIVLGLQWQLVWWGLRTRGWDLLATARRVLHGWRGPAFAALTFVAAAKISRPAEVSALEFVFATAVQLLALANLGLMVIAIPSDALRGFGARLDAWLGPRGGGALEPGGPDRFAWSVALAVTALAAALNVFVYERMPHVPDEVVYLLQARYFADGKLWLEPPPVPAAFDLDLMLLDGGKWYCPVPPGWPAMLALGVLAGVPWLVNPVLGGAAVLVAYAFFRELTDRRTARVAIVLLAASPWFLFLDMSFMTHAWTLVCALVAALGVARSRRTDSVAWCVVGGAALGMVALVRPLDGMLVAAALGLWSIGFGGAALRPPAVLALVASTALVASATAFYDDALTGDPAKFPIQHYVDVVYGPGKNDLGFGPEKGLGWSGLDPWPGHTPQEAIVTAQFNLFAVGAELFGWSAGSLALVWLLLLSGRRSRTDNAMLAFAALIVVSSLFYWFNGGPDFGARYWYLAFVPAVWLTVSGLRSLEERSEQPARVLAAVAVSIAVALSTFVPWRALDKYLGYRGVRGEALEVAARPADERCLVLVASGEETGRHPDFSSLAALNPLDWDANAPIYAWARNDETTRALLERFAGRKVWIVTGPSGPRGAWEVLAGPLEASEVLGRMP